MEVIGTGASERVGPRDKNEVFPLKSTALFLNRLLNESLRWAGPNYISIAFVGVIGFPFYYFVWAFWFPQPYENLPLRMVGAVLLFILLLKNKWPTPIKRFFPIYWYLTIIYSLPFFFVFMMLKNDGNTVWLLSVMIGLFLLVLLLDWINFLIMLFLGGGAAVVSYYFTTPNPVSLTSYQEYIAVFFFAIVSSSLFNYRTNVINREKMQAVARVGSYIAHELRTPLLSIRSGAGGIQKYLPRLIDSYHLAKENGLPIPEIREAHFRELSTVLDRVRCEAEYSNVVIDMLLTSSRVDVEESNDYAVNSMRKCVELALFRYPFKEGEREKVVFLSDNDFPFFGSSILMVHVVFNLLKNALQAVRGNIVGQVEVSLENGDGNHRLTVKDNGEGIPPELMPYVFRPFYTGNADSGGAGIGLAFCRLVVESFGGEIQCESEPGRYTKLTLLFKGMS